MKYSWDDIFRLPVSPDCLEKLVKSYTGSRGYKEVIESYRKGEINYSYAMYRLFNYTTLEEYTQLPAYLMATSNRQRALLAMRAKPDTKYRAKVLRHWKKAIASMTTLEKILAGWDKI